MQRYRMRRWVVVAVVLAASALATGCPKEKQSSIKNGSGKVPGNQGAALPKLTVGIQVSPAMALVMVAEDKGFFDKAGVDVEIKEFTAGGPSSSPTASLTSTGSATARSRSSASVRRTSPRP